MSSTAGGSGIGGAPQGMHVLEGGRVELQGGQRIDVTTVEGMQQAESLLTPEQLTELRALMQGVGYKLEGRRFVPDDSYGQVSRGLDRGPTSVAAGQTAEDAELAQRVFVDQGVPNPVNSNTTEAHYEAIKDSTSFQESVAALNEHLANPTPANEAKFMARFQALRAEFPHGNIMETLFLVFRESIKETNEDKKYFLIKLQEYNKMAEALSDYLSELVEASNRLSEASEGQKYPEKVHIPVQVRTFDFTSLDSKGRVMETTFGGRTEAQARESREAYFAKVDAEKEAKLADLDKQRQEGRFGYDDDDGVGRFGAQNSYEARRKKIEDDAAKKKASYDRNQMGYRRMDRAALNDRIKQVESMQETVRNKRQMASTAFQNFDQKSNQLYQLMASVLKSVNEMRAGTTRNML